MDYSSKLLVINKSIKGGCQSGRKVVTHNSKSDLLLVHIIPDFSTGHPS